MMGTHSYTGSNFKVLTFMDGYDLTIGDYVSISDDVTILLSGEHRTDTPSTYPFSERENYGNKNRFSKGDVKIGNDVWIGYRVTILSGVTIGDGAVVGACSLVNNDVPPYTIVGGVPAKKIGERKNPGVKWWEWDENKIKENIEWLTSEFH